MSCGFTAVAVGLDVVDIAAVGRFVAPGWVLTVPVSYFDGPAQRSGERSFAGHRDHSIGTVEHDPLQIGSDSNGTT